jgi:hypothetical protein
MSDLERLNLKDLPPVPSIDWPARYSQTLLKKADTCRRSAYLYVKHNGGTPGHQLDRGSLAHAVLQRMTEELIEAGQSSFIEPEFTQDRFGAVVEEDPEQAAKQIASMTAEVVDEVARERSDLQVPVAEVDAVRVMAYHWAVATKIDPEKVAGVERKFVMDIGGRETSGIVDYLEIDGRTARIKDYKTSWNRPEQDDYDKGFQPRDYALLVAFGQPVEKVPCSECKGGRFPLFMAEPGEDAVPVEVPCATCGGRGTVEERLPPIGAGLQYIETSEEYPRYLERLDDGTYRLQRRENTLSRTQLHDFRADVERLIAQLDEAQETGLFPAVSGDHCKECPARAECPLPKHLRDWQGAIESAEQAAEGAAWWAHWDDRLKKVKNELRSWAGENGGRIRFGTDVELAFQAQQSRGVRKRGKGTDWEGFMVAIQRAADGLEPLDMDHWVRVSSSNNFKKRTLTADELAAEREQGEAHGVGAGGSLEERFGVDPPW